MLVKVINNFLLRNLIILILFISPDILQYMARTGNIRVSAILTTCYNLSCFYSFIVFNNTVLFEKLALKRKYILYTVTFITTLVIWREATAYILWLVTGDGQGKYRIPELYDYNMAYWIFTYWANIIYMSIGLGVYLSYKYFRKQQQSLRLISINQELELKQLRQQLNPHFLFNALNNIYSYSIERNNKHTNELILKLSELMRFVTDKAGQESILLSEEISFLEHYLAFEHERLGYHCDIRFTNKVPHSSVLIEPFILFTFVENAFKHGTNQIGRSYVYIYTSILKNNLHLEVRNSMPPTLSNTPKRGVGLLNVKKRLEMLYAKKHNLLINNSESEFKVTLNVTLKS